MVFLNSLILKPKHFDKISIFNYKNKKNNLLITSGVKNGRYIVNPSISLKKISFSKKKYIYIYLYVKFNDFNSKPNKIIFVEFVGFGKDNVNIFFKGHFVNIE